MICSDATNASLSPGTELEEDEVVVVEDEAEDEDEDEDEDEEEEEEEDAFCSDILPIAYWSFFASSFTASAACLNMKRRPTSTSTEKTNMVDPSQLTSNAYSATR